jgi:hypothetical protein
VKIDIHFVVVPSLFRSIATGPTRHPGSPLIFES